MPGGIWVGGDGGRLVVEYTFSEIFLRNPLTMQTSSFMIEEIACLMSMRVQIASGPIRCGRPTVRRSAAEEGPLDDTRMPKHEDW